MDLYLQQHLMEKQMIDLFLHDHIAKVRTRYRIVTLYAFGMVR